MQYTVHHLTRFVYTSPVCENVTELRMQPLERPGQQTLRFNVTTSHHARVFAYRDHYENAVHYFDIPGHHSRLDISVESAVTVLPMAPLPDRLPDETWQQVDAMAGRWDNMDWLAPSNFAKMSPALAEFARAIGFKRRGDPLTTLRSLSSTLFAQFAYEPRSTRVDSPIDEALRARAGVCQDFAHIMTALVRSIGIPCRYVSGYIAPRDETSIHDRAGSNATHAWVEALLPNLGWLGFDPTNDVLASDRHIAVAIGRDYSDVPPTRGVFKGSAGSELSVAVGITSSERHLQRRELSPSVIWIVAPRPAPYDNDVAQSQQ
ncbi:MAG: transglutaminase family protein [Acidobacteriota bacterium]